MKVTPEPGQVLPLARPWSCDPAATTMVPGQPSASSAEVLRTLSSVPRSLVQRSVRTSRFRSATGHHSLYQAGERRKSRVPFGRCPALDFHHSPAVRPSKNRSPRRSSPTSWVADRELRSLQEGPRRLDRGEEDRENPFGQTSSRYAASGLGPPGRFFFPGYQIMPSVRQEGAQDTRKFLLKVSLLLLEEVLADWEG